MITKTTIGNNCLFMISSHIAHDCKVGNNVIIANNVPLGGHVTLEDPVVIGGISSSAIYKNRKISNDRWHDLYLKMLFRLGYHLVTGITCRV